MLINPNNKGLLNEKGGDVKVPTLHNPKRPKFIMAIRKEKTSQEGSLEETKQEILDMLIWHEVKTLIFDSDVDSNWIDFFKTQPGWQAALDDDQIVSFNYVNGMN